MTGILVSLNGGVMKPMWNLWFGSGVGIEDEEGGRREESAWCMPAAVVGEVGDEGRVAGCGEEVDDEGFKCEERRRVASVRTVTRRGRSVDERV